jgi:ankyrin repeat protein
LAEESTASAIAAGIRAAKSGNLAEVTQWLEAGNDPDQYDASGWTPLLWASARGHSEVVELLLENGADIAFPQRDSGALAVHMAGHCGDVKTAEVLLRRRPELLDAVWDLNGHTVLLQTVFYGHLDLAGMLLQRQASTAITTARGLGPMELATQFQNQAMIDLLKPYDSPVEAKAAYYQSYLKRIAPVVPAAEREIQTLADELVAVIGSGIRQAATDPGAVVSTLEKVRELVEVRGADVNRLGGPLQQPALVVTVTGNNGWPAVPAVAQLRNQVAKFLLDHGADPVRRENHPMGAQTVIRAAVFNHLDILKMCAAAISPQRMADAINEYPVVNGLTAMHDTVLRATMAGPDRIEGYLEQTRFFVMHGGRTDIEDFAGVTQRELAFRVKDPQARQRLLDIIDGRN